MKDAPSLRGAKPARRMVLVGWLVAALAAGLATAGNCQDSAETLRDALFKERAERAAEHLRLGDDLQAKLEAATVASQAQGNAAGGPGGTFTVEADKPQPGGSALAPIVLTPDVAAKYTSAMKDSRDKSEMARTIFQRAIDAYTQSKVQEKAQPNRAAELRKIALTKLQAAEKLIEDTGASLHTADDLTGGRFQSSFVAEPRSISRRAFPCDTACEQLRLITGVKIGEADRQPSSQPKLNLFDINKRSPNPSQEGPKLLPPKDDTLKGTFNQRPTAAPTNPITGQHLSDRDAVAAKQQGTASSHLPLIQQGPKPTLAVTPPERNTQRGPQQVTSARQADLQGFDRQQRTITINDGRIIPAGVFFDAFGKLGIKDPLVRHEPPVPGAPPAVRLSPAAQRALVQKRDQLRKVGGIALDVTFEALSFAGVPDLQIDGPTTLIENPVLISLRRLLEAAKPFASSPERWRSLPEHIRYPGSLGRVHGFVLDPTSDDVIIVGTAATTSKARLDIDLFTVLIEAVWKNNIDPGVSLEPLPDNLAGPQYTRVIGLPADSLIARILLDADYEMKRITIGAAKIPGANFDTVEIYRRSGDRNDRFNRLWFRPLPLSAGTLRVSDSGQVALHDAGIELLSESQGIDGKSGSVSASLAKQFTRSYAYFESSLNVKPVGIYGLLRGIVDITTMCKVLRESGIDYRVLDDLRQLPYRRLVGAEAAPSYYPGIRITHMLAADHGLILSGGIELLSRVGRNSLDKFEDYVVRRLERAASEFKTGEFTQQVPITFTLRSPELPDSSAIQGKIDGLRKLAEGKADAASQRFRELAEQDPTDVDAWIYLGLAEAQSGRIDSAWQAIRRAQAIDSTDPLVRKAALRLELLTVPNFEPGVDPSTPRALSADHVSDAHAALLRDDLDGACTSGTIAIRLWAGNSEAYAVRARCRYLRKDFADALKDIDSALAIAPNNVQFNHIKGVVLSLMDDTPGAVRAFDRAIQLDPRNAATYSARAEAHRRVSLDRALQDINAAIQLEPQYARHFSQRGSIYSASGEVQKAMHDFNQAIRLDPKDYLAFYSRGFAFLSGNDLHAADKDFSTAIALLESGNIFRSRPLHLNTNHVLRGFVRSLLGRCREAEQDLQRAKSFMAVHADLEREITDCR